MTSLTTVPATPRLGRLGAVVTGARMALFAVAIGVFLAAPPSLPWVLAVVSLTNVVFLATRAWMAGGRPPIALLVINGLTVTLVIAYGAITGFHA